METQQDLIKILTTYVQQYPGEILSLEAINNFVQSYAGENLYARTNFVGHITASAFIYNPVSKSLLFIKHTALNRWLQPGGHIEVEDKNLLAASLREAEEETGIPAIDFVVTPHLFDVDSHAIPENIKKNEPAHFHHDMRYLLLYDEPHYKIMVQKDVSGCEWIAMDDLKKEGNWSGVIAKIEALY